MASKEEKQKLSGNNLLVVMLLISFLVVGVTVLVIKVLFADIVLDTNVLKAKSTADKAVKADVTAAPELISAFSALGSQGTELNDALPVTVDFPSLLIEVESMANSAGVTLTGVTSTEAAGATPSAAGSSQPGSTSTSTSTATGSTVTIPTPQDFTFSISYNGSFDATTRLLGDLQASVRPMTVTGVTLNGTGNTLNGVLNLTTYYQNAAQLPFGTETVK